MSQLSRELYELKPIKLGCEVRGVDLKTENRTNVIDGIKKNITRHCIFVFKNQGKISGDRHVEISKWFGELESSFYHHQKSPHPYVFRISNDQEEGYTGIGRAGWNIDGSFQKIPFSYSLYHMVSVPKTGATAFAPLSELIANSPPHKQEEWEHLWMISDNRIGPIHPLIYKHPITSAKVLCFDLGMISGFVYDYGSKSQRMATKQEYHRIPKDIHEEFVKNDGTI